VAFDVIALIETVHTGLFAECSSSTENFESPLGVKTVDDGLFHLHGNFPSHVFIELPLPEAQPFAWENGVGAECSRPEAFLVIRLV